jgi:trans-aconitate 2-methyltransferase
MSWSPEQYLKFAEPRLRPALDLLARVGAVEPDPIFDIGCGAGNVTRFLVERWPTASITGIDDSAEMLERASKTLPGVRFVLENLARWRPLRPAGVIFSNAALHWLPDHAGLFARLVEGLSPGGVLAVQMPRNFSAPSHTAIAEAVRAGAWKAKLEPLLGPAPVEEPRYYYELLAPRLRTLDVWETEYLQVLEGEDPVKEWTKGTWLKPFLDALAPDERAAFEEDYAARLRSAYPPLAGGKTLFPFRRLFIVGTK